MRIIRYSFLAACASLALSNAYAMDQDPPKHAPVTSSAAATEDQWTFREVENYYLHRVGTFSKVLLIKPPEDSSAVAMEIGWLLNPTRMHVQVCMWNFLNEKTEGKITIIKNQLELENIPYTAPCIAMFAISNHSMLGKFLQVFYNNGIIPDVAVSRITQYMGIADFRIN